MDSQEIKKIADRLRELAGTYQKKKTATTKNVQNEFLLHSAANLLDRYAHVKTAEDLFAKLLFGILEQKIKNIVVETVEGILLNK